jgi:3-isopropylmalate dehydrogenase
MALRYSFSRIEDANLLEKAISSVLESGLRTKDISTNDSKVISTSEMGDAVISKLNELS